MRTIARHRMTRIVPWRACALGVVMLVACALVPLMGCPGPDNPYLPYPEPDFVQYQSTVQPIVDRSCSNLGCHGESDRRLTFYSVDFLRAEPTVPGTPLDSDMLTLAEIAWNYDSLRARLIDEESADGAHLLLKNLDPEAGGIVHADGFVVFATVDDPDYVALRDWIETGL